MSDSPKTKRNVINLQQKFNEKKEKKSIINIENEKILLNKHNFIKDIIKDFLEQTIESKSKRNNSNLSTISKNDLIDKAITRIINFNNWHYDSKSKLKHNYNLILALISMKQKYLMKRKNINFNNKNLVSNYISNLYTEYIDEYTKKNNVNTKFKKFESYVEYFEKLKEDSMNNEKYNKKYAQIKIKEEINDKINELIKFNNEITIKILELKNSTKSRSNNKKIDREFEKYRESSKLPDDIKKKILENYTKEEAGGGGHCGYLSIMAYAEENNIELIPSDEVQIEFDNSSKKLRAFLLHHLNMFNQEIKKFIKNNPYYFEADTSFLTDSSEKEKEKKINRFIDDLEFKLINGLLNNTINGVSWMDDSILKLIALICKVNILVITNKGENYDKLFIDPKNEDYSRLNDSGKLNYLLEDDVIKIYNKVDDHFQWFKKKKSFVGKMVNLGKSLFKSTKKTNNSKSVSSTQNKQMSLNNKHKLPIKYKHYPENLNNTGNKSILDKPIEKLTIIIDAGGVVFEGNRLGNVQGNYTGASGFSGNLYNKMKNNKIEDNRLFSKYKKNMGVIKPGEAKINPTTFRKNDNYYQVIHAVGPNGKILDEKEYWKTLKLTFESIGEILKKKIFWTKNGETNRNNGSLKNINDYEIRLPLISTNIFRPKVLTNDQFYPQYFNHINKYINEFLLDYRKNIVLGLFSEVERRYFKRFKTFYIPAS